MLKRILQFFRVIEHDVESLMSPLMRMRDKLFAHANMKMAEAEQHRANADELLAAGAAADSEAAKAATAATKIDGLIS